MQLADKYYSPFSKTILYQALHKWYPLYFYHFQKVILIYDGGSTKVWENQGKDKTQNVEIEVWSL